MLMNSFIIVCLYCHVVELTCTLIKIIFCVMLLIRLLIYASVIVVSSVRFIPYKLNLNSRPKTLEAFNFNSQIDPGDFVNNFFSFCNWNINSLAKDNFYRVRLLGAHNSFHNYDFISICETSLDDTVELPDVMLENDNFVSCNNPSNTRRGGVG